MDATAVKNYKESQLEVTTASFIPYGSHITKSCIRLVNGDYMEVIKLQGAAHESADPANINAWHRQLNNCLKNLASPHVALWTHIVRREFNEYPEGDFANNFANEFNEKYAARIGEKSMLVNELYVSIIYRPQPIKAFKLLPATKNTAERDAEIRADLEVVTDLRNTVLTELERYEPDLLTTYEHNDFVFSQVQEFLAYLVDGEWSRQPVARGEIRKNLCRSRPFFGKGGLLSLKSPTGHQYGAALVIEEYPTPTYPGILNDLLAAPYELVLTQSFTFINRDTALGRMKQQEGRLLNSDDAATSQILEIAEAMDDLASSRIVFGAHHLTLFVKASTQEVLNRNVGDAGTCLSSAGMKWAREDVGLGGAFWSQLPGNFKYRVRVSEISSRNFAAFSSMHNYPIGRISGTQWGPAVAVFRTTSGAPYYFSFHKVDPDRTAKFDPNHKELANTTVIGPSGAGKTVLEMTLLAQTLKFNKPQEGKPLTAVLFDKDLGASIGIKALGGRYYPIRSGEKSGWNPFHLADTPKNLIFLETFVKQLVYKESLPFSPKQEQDIVKGIKGVMSAPKELRRLSSLLEFFDPTDETGIGIRLARWCSATGGSLAWLFDNEVDTLNLDDTPLLGFDVTDFLHDAETRGPTIMYLFHRIEELIDGRRIPIFMDEFPNLLGDPYFEDFAKNKLVTIRKQDGFIVAFAQYPKQILDSSIASAMVEQSSTMIFLPNNKASQHDYVEGMKLTQREYEIIRDLPEKSRKFLIKQGKNSVVAELDLKGFSDELAVLSSNTATSNMVEKIIAAHGDDPDVWLPEFHRLRKGM